MVVVRFRDFDIRHCPFYQSLSGLLVALGDRRLDHGAAPVLTSMPSQSTAPLQGPTLLSKQSRPAKVETVRSQQPREEEDEDAPEGGRQQQMPRQGEGRAIATKLPLSWATSQTVGLEPNQGEG